MWLRLETDEVRMVALALQRHADQMNGGLPGHIEAEKLLDLSEKILAPPHPETKIFRDAVSTSDELEVDVDAVISRGDDGAFVMSWSWISNEEASL